VPGVPKPLLGGALTPVTRLCAGCLEPVWASQVWPATVVPYCMDCAAVAVPLDAVIGLTEEVVREIQEVVGVSREEILAKHHDVIRELADRHHHPRRRADV